MKLRVQVVAMALFASSGCSTGPPGSGADTTWVGTITTEGNVTTVVNESGSVWGGAATLGEEASIGVEVGPEEYMWGRVRGLAATDERIYVVDPSVPIVRVYDFGGQHLMNVGRGGQGPAEFVNPEGIVVASDGKIFRWLERLQIEEAKAMFERENYTVTRVAADLDMDLRTLERKFLRVEGCLPTEYKRRIARLVAGTTQLPPQSTTGA